MLDRFTIGSRYQQVFNQRQIHIAQRVAQAFQVLPAFEADIFAAHAVKGIVFFFEHDNAVTAAGQLYGQGKTGQPAADDGNVVQLLLVQRESGRAGIC